MIHGLNISRILGHVVCFLCMLTGKSKEALMDVFMVKN